MLAGPRMERWNYYFEAAKAASIGGAAVDLPRGHGIVTFGENGATERVFFPAGQIEFDLVGGAIERLVREGLAKRYGRLK